MSRHYPPGHSFITPEITHRVEARIAGKRNPNEQDTEYAQKAVVIHRGQARPSEKSCVNRHACWPCGPHRLGRPPSEPPDGFTTTSTSCRGGRPTASLPWLYYRIRLPRTGVRRSHNPTPARPPHSIDAYRKPLIRIGRIACRTRTPSRTGRPSDAKNERRWSWTKFRWMCGCGDGWPCTVLRAGITTAPELWAAGAGTPRCDRVGYARGAEGTGPAVPVARNCSRSFTARRSR
jgi:hypothetical protein